MFLRPQQQLERAKRVMRQRVQPYIHPVLSHLTVSSYDIPGEPMPKAEFFARLHSGEIQFIPFSMGNQWGTIWGTTWFKLEGQVPQNKQHSHAIELWIDLGWYNHSCGGHIEGLVYDENGHAIKAVHPLNHWVPLIDSNGKSTVTLANDGNFTVYLEAACNPLLLGVPPFVETQLGECATGKPEELYTFRAAYISEFNEEFEQYYVDLDVVTTLMEQTATDTPRYWQLAKALQRSLNTYDEQRPQTIVSARQALQPVLKKPANASAMDVYAVGHAHIDSAWLWPVRETRRKVARTVANVLALMDVDPDFCYAMSSAQQYVWLRDGYPDLFERMLARVREGRFIPVGGMWVECDGMLPSGESLVRQISFGRRFFQDVLGVVPRGVWLPDSFGYSGAWPQIARRAGFDWFLTQKISWNDTTKFPHHSFYWRGIDGTSIFTHFPPSDTYAAWMTAKELVDAEKNFQDKDISDKALMLFGFGDGGGGPTREMLEHIERFGNLEGVSKVHMSTPDVFFDQARTQIESNTSEDELPTYQGELYLELHRATLTSQQDMKQGCRKEEALLRTVEYLGAVAAIYDTTFVYPKEEIDEIWKTLLLNQFHDILPGSGIAWVHRQAREDYQRDIKRLRSLISRLCKVLATAMPNVALLDSATISQFAVNASWRPQNRSLTKGLVSVTENGQGVHVNNGVLDVQFDQSGAIVSLLDVANARQLVPEGQKLGTYELLRDEPSVWDAWDIERDAFLMHKTLESKLSSVENGEQGAHVRVTTVFGTSSIDTDIFIEPESKYVRYETHVDWHEKEKFLKINFPLTLTARNAQYDHQYGYVERPIQKNNPSEEAKFESATHRFIRIAEPQYAAAVINASTYGSDVYPIVSQTSNGQQMGTMVRLSLLSSPVFPDPRTDQGKHSFTFAVLADASMERTQDIAGILNAPVIEQVPAFEPLVQLELEDGLAIVDWIKLADDGSGDLIVRLYEAQGGHAEGILVLAEPLQNSRIRETNILEQDCLADDLPVCLESREKIAAKNARISLAPFEMATLRISRN